MLGIITGFIDELRGAGVPVSMVEAIDGMRAVEAIEIGDRIALRETLRATRGNKSRAARALDTDYKTLHVKMNNLGIRAKDFTP